MNPPAKIVVTESIVTEWPRFKKLLDEGKIVADKTGRLRYPHGAPVGHLILAGTAKDGTPRYQESAEEWFDPAAREHRSLYGQLAPRSASSDAMTTEYEITKDDLTAFNLYHHFHSPTARRQYLRSWFFPALIWLLICTGIWFLADRERATPLRTFLDLLPLFAGVPLYFIYFPWAYRRKVRKIIAGMVSEGQNRGLFCRHRVVISPDGITDSGEFGQATTTWRAVERVAQNGDHAFVYTNALAAIIVPRRAFAAPTAFEEFVRAASGYHEKQRG